MANRSSPDHLRIATAPVPLTPLIGRERELARAEGLGVSNGARVPFVRDGEDRVQWVSFGLRPVPRVDAHG
jgi:hypothetical protein